MQITHDGEVEGCHHLSVSEHEVTCADINGHPINVYPKESVEEIHGLGGLMVTEEGETYAASCHGGLRIEGGEATCVGTMDGPNDRIDWDRVEFVWEGA